MKRFAAFALVVSTGCLSVPEAPAPECQATSDCDSASGEVCEEGTCWGNPPKGTFAAVISPPSDRKDLVPKELTQIVISEAGWMNALQLEVPVTFSGRIEAVCAPPVICDRSTLGATLTVTRSSQFHGGPGFKAVVSSESGAAGSSFDIPLPRTNENDAHYTVTVVPDGRGPEPLLGPPTPAQLVPPLRFDLAVGSTAARTITLGALDLPSIDGTVTTSAGAGLSQYRVVALGHWELGAPNTEVSTVDYTGSDGKFRLLLSKDLVGPVEIVAKPYGSILAPTLHLGGVASVGALTRTLTQPPPATVGVKTNLSVKVMGVVDGGGGVGPVHGARVKVVGRTAPLQMGGAAARFLAEATTDDNGIARLELLDGSIKDSYRLEVVPPASASVGVMFDRQMTSLAPMSIILTSRIPIRGHVVNIHGDPIKDVSVTARPSLRFIWSLEDAPQSFLSAIPVATTVTPSTGEFVLWVDPTVAGTWGHYDLVFEPSFKSGAPSWIESDIEIPRMIVDSVLLPEVRLPDAAFVHGMVTDAYGSAVLGSEVKLFHLDTSLALCSEVSHAPASCPIPAVLQGRGASDDLGVVRLTLPR